jgi:hypothetical protein
MWLSPAILGYGSSDNVEIQNRGTVVPSKLGKQVKKRAQYLAHGRGEIVTRLAIILAILVNSHKRLCRSFQIIRWGITGDLDTEWNRGSRHHDRYIPEQQTMPKTLELSTERLYSEQVDNMTLNK